MLKKLDALNWRKAEHVYRTLKTDVREVEHILRHPHLFYRTFPLMKNGKTRIIDEPLGRLSDIQKLLNRALQRLKFHPAVAGGIKGTSNVKNAGRHISKPMQLKLDIRNFFPSITHRRVYKMCVETLGCSPDVARIITGLVTYQRRVPQGARTSPIIAILTATKMIRRFDGLTKQHGSAFSQYIDDSQFSGPNHLRRLKNLSAKIVQSEGFDVHPRKIVATGQDGEQIVTGVKTNRRTDLPAKLAEDVARLIDQFPALLRQDSTAAEKVLASIKGKIAYCRTLNRHAAADLNERLAAVVIVAAG